jgi:hypothetical protein
VPVRTSRFADQAPPARWSALPEVAPSAPQADITCARDVPNQAKQRKLAQLSAFP